MIFKELTAEMLAPTGTTIYVVTGNKTITTTIESRIWGCNLRDAPKYGRHEVTIMPESDKMWEWWATHVPLRKRYVVNYVFANNNSFVSAFNDSEKFFVAKSTRICPKCKGMGVVERGDKDTDKITGRLHVCKACFGFG